MRCSRDWLKVTLADAAAYCGLAPDCATTCAHLAISLLMKAANSLAVPGVGSAPTLRICSCVAGSVSPAATAALSLAMISSGVPAGATRPNQPIDSYPGRPASAKVGTSGSDATRRDVETPS